MPNASIAYTSSLSGDYISIENHPNNTKKSLQNFCNYVIVLLSSFTLLSTIINRRLISFLIMMILISSALSLCKRKFES